MKTVLYACLCFLGLLLSDGALGQTVNYTDETALAGYVKQMLYWPDAPQDKKGTAAFRYKHMLYTNDHSGVRAQLATLTNLAFFANSYRSEDRELSRMAEAELRRGLTNRPASLLLRNLLLDIYYDRTVAEVLFARAALEKAERAHFGEPVADPAPAGGFIIDNEIPAYIGALQSNRTALATYSVLLTNTLGVADGNPTPLGYRIFQEQVPTRGLEAALYIDKGGLVCVTEDTSPLFAGYKDLVLLYELLSDQGRIATALARLWLLRNAPGDGEQAEALMAEAERSLILHAQVFRTAFPALNENEGSLAHSGLATAMAGVSASLYELEGLRQLQRSALNPLGFEPDFLVLVQGAFAGEEPRADTYDAFLVHLNDTNSALGLARNTLADARASYEKYRGFEDDLADQFAGSSITYYDRLRDIVGYFPYDPLYATVSQGAPGSDLDQQTLSVEAARLQIRKNQVEIANVNEQTSIELEKAASISNVYVKYGDKQAAITEWIGLINGAQAAANELAEEAESAGTLNLWGTAGHGANAMVQYAAEIGKGVLEAQKERLTAFQSAEITGIEAKATVKILLLQMNTLAVDSLSAALQLRKEVNRLQDLYREKSQLERNLQEKDQNLTRRYFADPVHRLVLQANMVKADLAFAEAQRWLFYMARALEYKWNEPVERLLHGWRMADLYKLRNADELRQMYAAMKLYDDERVMSTTSDDRFDWFSVREQFLGYPRSNELGQVAFYRDAITGQTNDALGAFRLHLSRLVTNGWIELDFSTVREIENKSFFRGPTYFADGRVDLTKPGYYLDKIRWLKIRLPGNHAQEPVSGYLRYGGTSYLRNRECGIRDPEHPDRILGEMTAYGTRHWKKVGGQWIFTEGINAGISMLKVPRTEPRLDGNPAHPDVLPSVNQIDVFRERSVAATRWHLAIPVTGAGSVSLSNLDDIEIYFYHWSFNR
ncbi:MAG TPA: hypothetical protein P5186_27955 [Candidatus Paceibacterota bacterium]|nr:hypothetical protein [Verrucomicrobiota bacterium]HRY51885.1 hypothetical protein [Candidatus Paceibacterota bacterium]HSA00615.1 hypothetical protein [Candidatus Paceibacterota bacterium]